MNKTVLFIVMMAMTSLSFASDKNFYPPLKDKIPAFPGAEGFGMYTSGGRGGKVYIVNNLRDYKRGGKPIKGSLRQAVEAKGPRTVVFAVSGTIELVDKLHVGYPDLTIAGQTAPGDGICIKNYQTVLNFTENVIIRHIRFRPGDEIGKELVKQGKHFETDALWVQGSKKVMLDHCSASWSIDELFGITKDADNVTVQWCILNEALSHSTHPKGEHSKGPFMAYIIDGKISMHHNLVAHNISRNPRPGSAKDHEITKGLLFDFRNNVIYNWGKLAGYSAEEYDLVRMNYAGNYLLAGPSTKKGENWDRAFKATPRIRIFQSGNMVNKKEVGWEAIPGVAQTNKMKDSWKVAPMTYHSAMEAYDLVLAEAGATLPKRDAVDIRVVEEVKNGTGKIIDSPSEVGGWPEYKSATPPVDDDEDGMPDEWEKKYGLNPKDGKDHKKDMDGDGYTNIEEYLNGTDPSKKEVM